MAKTKVGTNSSNTLNGTSGADHIYGLGGNDTLNGNAGSDVLYGGKGNDKLYGGKGNDHLLGNGYNSNSEANEKGNDSMYGGAGNDNYYSSYGKDIIDDTAGSNDRLIMGVSSGSLNSIHALNLFGDDDNIDSLRGTLGSSSITIYHYFDNTATSAEASHAGAGYIERIIFTNNVTYDFDNIQDMLAH
jgi:Ca2+-binding RTX toxin-like protein